MPGKYIIVAKFELNGKTSKNDKDEIRDWLRAIGLSKQDPLEQFDIYEPVYRE